jgi:type IV pilus assembly protein PilZ
MVPRPERYCVDIPVDCSTKDLFISNRITNLSRGGLFIESPKPLPLQSDVDLTIRLQCPEVTITAIGRVIWNYDIRKGTSHIVPGNGIKIIAISPEHRALLEACLALLAKPQGAPAVAGR